MPTPGTPDVIACARVRSAALEYVSLSAAKPDWFASFGAEARETDERIGNDNWSPNPPHNGSFQERYLFVSDLHFGPNLRTFIEFKSDFANGRIGGNRPIDGDDVDFLGLFVEAKVGDSAASPTLRIGREELLLGSGRLLAPREGPNVRQSFTGFRAQNTVGSFALDVLAVHPDKDASTFFADAPDNATSLWGLYSTTKSSAIGIDAYYLGINRDAYVTVRGTADETRHTFGLRADERFSDRSAGLDFDDEVMYQSGRFDARPISAWSIGPATGWHSGPAPISPHLPVKADIASGDDSKRKDVGTFDPYFPANDYFGVLATTGPGRINFVDLHPAISTTIGRLTATVDCLWYWRESLTDGLYSTSGTLIRLPMGSTARFVGQQPGVISPIRSIPMRTSKPITVSSRPAGSFVRPGPRVQSFIGQSSWAISSGESTLSTLRVPASPKPDGAPSEADGTHRFRPSGQTRQSLRLLELNTACGGS